MGVCRWDSETLTLCQTPFSSILQVPDFYTLSQTKPLENHTLHSGTYLYRLYMGVPPLPGLRSISLTSAFPGFSSVIPGIRVLYEPEIRSQIIAGFPSKHRKQLKNLLPVWWLLPLLGDSRSLFRRFSVLRSITVMPRTKEKARSESGIQICPTNNRGSVRKTR